MKIYHINFNANEFFYLYLFLLNISNYIFFKILRTMNNDLYSIYYIVYIIKDLIYNNIE